MIIQMSITTFIILYIASIIISYFIYRYNYTHMSDTDKDTFPFIVVIMILFIPMMNLVYGGIMNIMSVKVDDDKNIKMINKIFNVKSK